MRSFLSLLMAGAVLSGCAEPGYRPSETLASGEAAQAMAVSQSDVNAALAIGAFDVLSIRVYEEPDLSFDEIQVDPEGFVTFPLVGRVQAAGYSTAEFGNRLATGLQQGYFRDPQIVVGLVSSPTKRVVVEGSVKQPGVFNVSGASSLIEAIALAQGPTEQAKLDEVAIFRVVDGERMGAIFDFQAIREGEMPDPQVLPGDRVVVGFDKTKGIYRDFLRAAPLFSIFTRF